MIFGLLLLYFIGKYYFELAIKFNKNKWLYAILGVVSYYVFGLLFTTIIMVLDIWLFEWGFDWEDKYGMSLLVIPIGILSTWVLYSLLERKWEKNFTPINDEIDEIGKF